MSDGREGAARLPKVHEPGRYRIRVSGRIDSSWVDRFSDMAIVSGHTESAECFTELTGWVADQAALQGYIDQMYAHGHVLLAVELLDDGGRADMAGKSRKMSDSIES